MNRCKDCVAKLFGPCNDYCAIERRPLEENALLQFRALGHVPGPFVRTPGVAVWTSTCLACQRRVTIALDPLPGQPDITGNGLDEPCTRDTNPHLANEGKNTEYAAGDAPTK